jgi:hypothetical protein
MTSLIQNAASFGITYTASSLTVRYNYEKPENVFIDDDSSWFHSLNDPPNQWWQVSFSKKVAISSYIIRSVITWPRRQTDWHIIASIDGFSWKTVHTVIGKETGGNTEKFYLDNTIHCVHFRIVLDKNVASDNVLAFTFFDCFDEAIPIQTSKCYCNTRCKQCFISFQTFILTLVNFIT